jgi:hypothetical protein
MRKNSYNSNKISLVLQVERSDPLLKLLKVFLFGTPEFVHILVSKEHTVEQIIYHMVALTDTDPYYLHERVKRLFVVDLPFQLLDKYKNSNCYELRFLEDESNLEDGYFPLYDTDPLERKNYRRISSS